MTYKILKFSLIYRGTRFENHCCAQKRALTSKYKIRLESAEMCFLESVAGVTFRDRLTQYHT
jgi:hypothetical protein